MENSDLAQLQRKRCINGCWLGMEFHTMDFFLCKDVTDTLSRKKRSSSHKEEGETTETFVAQMTVFDKNR